MSILSDYEDIKQDIGEEKWDAIDKYLETERPDLRLDQILYNPQNWMAFEKWFFDSFEEIVNVTDVWLYQDGEYRANVEIGREDEIFGTTVVGYMEKDIRNFVGKSNEELTTEELKNAIAILALRDLDIYESLPNITEASELLREIYDSVRSSDESMCFITYDDWKECYAEDYTNEDFEKLKEEVKKYGLEEIVVFDQDDCKITGYADIEKAFVDNRKEPVKEMTTLDYLNEEKQMIEHNISCYSDGNFISKAKKGYETQFAKEQQKLVIVEKLISDEKQKMKKYEDRER